jgi:hypothetical protein
MDIMPRGDMPSDDLQIAIREAQATLIQAGDGMPPRDPMRFLAAGLSHFLGVLGRTTRRGEKAVADIIEARSPLTVNDTAAITEAMEKGAYKAVKQEVNRLTRRMDWQQSRKIGLAVGLLPLGALAIGVGLDRWVLTHPDISGMICQDERGGRLCYLWASPPTQPMPAPKPAAPAEQQQTPAPTTQPGKQAAVRR